MPSPTVSSPDPVLRSPLHLALPFRVATCRLLVQDRPLGFNGAIVRHITNGVFKALAHPIRREIVERLSAGGATVGDATAGLGVSKPTISQHLKTLEEAGVVVRVVDGRTHRLTLNGRRLGEASTWIELQRSRWEHVLDVVDEYLEERRETQ